MFTLRKLFFTMFLGALVASPLTAQQTPAATSSGSPNANALDAALVEHQSVVDSQRADLAEFLARDDVRQIADLHGVEWMRVTGAPAVLSDAEIARVAPLVEKPVAVAQDLGSVRVSVAAVIIVLLLLIVLT